MSQTRQLPLFTSVPRNTGKARSGTFTDNMRRPVHRWFRYSAGFSADWVEQLISDQHHHRGASSLSILDPFAGSGTTLIGADSLGISSVGIEAHPFVVRVARAKMLWSGDIDEFERRSHTILRSANRMNESNHHYPKLIQECFSTRSLEQLDKLRHAWLETQDDSSASELTWLAITSILRLSASAGTAQWQYILPRQKKQKTIEPFAAFQAQISMMIDDMTEMQASSAKSMSILVEADARHCPELRTNSADLVITSPPYANNYDYADATRFEMSFWGEVESWADLHQAVRQYLIVSSSQHASKERLELDSLLEKDVIAPIHSGLSIVCSKLAKERLEHGGKKHYHTMVAAYFIDLANVWNELRRICKPGATVCYVIGDSAPYGIYVPVDEWLGRLAVAAGFRDFRFEKLRDRNIKWKNRKHRVPLKEGRLWING